MNHKTFALAASTLALTLTAGAVLAQTGVRDGSETVSLSSAAGGRVPVLSCGQPGTNGAMVNLSTGQPGWTLKLPNGTASGIIPMPWMVPSQWAPLAGAQWVGPQGPLEATGLYTYEAKVRINKCPKGNPAKLTASFRADNIGTLSLIAPNGSVVKSMAQAGAYDWGFVPASLSPAGAPGVHIWAAPSNGIYTIRLSVQNSGGPTGVAANIQLTR